MSSVLKRISQALRRTSASDVVGAKTAIREEMKRLGLQFITDENLGYRIGVIYKLLNLVYRELGEEEEGVMIRTPEDRIKLMNYLIKMAGMAWARAGDNSSMAKVMTDWQILVKDGMDLYATIDRERDEERKYRLMDLFDKFVKRDILPYGEMVLNLTFTNRDVFPQFLALIQVPGGMIPGAISGGQVPPMYQSSVGGEEVASGSTESD